MPASKHVKTLSVRLPQPLLHTFKIAAAARGTSLQQAIIDAMNAWVARPQAKVEPLENFEGSLADTDVLEFMRRERESELAKDESRMR